MCQVLRNVFMLDLYGFVKHISFFKGNFKGEKKIIIKNTVSIQQIFIRHKTTGKNVMKYLCVQSKMLIIEDEY